MPLPGIRSLQGRPPDLMRGEQAHVGALDMMNALDQTRPPSYAPPAYKLPPALGLGPSFESPHQRGADNAQPVDPHRRPRMKSPAASTTS